MTSRFPLVIDYQTQRLTELPENDDLDFTNSRLLNVQEISVTGELSSNTANIANLSVSGNVQATFFIGDGGLLSNISGGGGGNGVVTPPGGQTTQVQYNKGGLFAGDSGMVYNDTTNTLTVGNISTDGYRIGNIPGANVTGWVANANVANLAALSNNSIALNSEIANIRIAGGSMGQVLTTDGAGVITFETPRAEATAGGNVGEIQFNTANLLDATNALKTDGNSLIITNEGGVASITEYIYSNTSDNTVTTYRARGDRTAPLPVQVGDRILGLTSIAYTGNGTATYDGNAGWAAATLASITGTISSVPTANGRLAGAQLNFNVSNSLNNTSSTMTFAESGKVTVPGVMKVGSVSASVLRGTTGSIGEIIAVSDGSAGGKLAYWDTTNNRWSYVFSNAAV
jgi:hypothetical protein